MARAQSKNNLPSVLTLFIDSARDAWQMKGRLVGLLLVVSVPVSVITALTGDESPLLSYLSLATMFMNVALIWAIIEQKQGRRVTIASAYYQGTASVVRFAAVALVLAIEFIPFAIGAAIYAKGVSGGSLAVGLVERLLLMLIWMLLSWPTAFWITRSAFALNIIVSSSARPLAAITRSSRLVRGRSLAVFGRLVILVFAMLILLSVPSAALVSLTNNAARVIGSISLQLLATVIFLPFTNIYLYNLYLSLADAKE